MDVQVAYDELIAGIFKKAFDDLVAALRTARREELKRKNWKFNPEEMTAKERTAKSSAAYLEQFIRDVMPNWLEIDPERFIRWEHEEAGNET